jgi:hypothetical protein
MLIPARVLSQAPPIGKGNIKIGSLEVHPSVVLNGTYTDNVYQSYDGKSKESDIITTFSPGLQLVLPFSRHNFQTGFRSDFYSYTDFSENDYVHKSANAIINLDFPGGLFLTVSDFFVDSETVRKWKKLPDLRGSLDPYRAKPYQSNDLLVKARYRFADRWAADLWYNLYKYDYNKRYDNDGSFDRNLFGASLFYRFTPRTDALLEYQSSAVEYPYNTFFDNMNNTIYVGIGFDPSAKINGYAKFGWTQKKYDKKLAGLDDEFNEFSTQIDLGFNITPNDTINFRGIRAIEEDSDTNAPYTKSDFSIGYSHILSMNSKIRPYARIGFAKHEYDGWATDTDGILNQRDDDIFYTSVGIDYAMKNWLIWNLGYTYNDNDSNFIRYDYNENRMFLNATVAF